ncbi:MAG: histidinol-phosphate transaminase [Lachnospiraceae bacterium]|nr:histidinol-phosphate transaminase [Lachnospiraceae bacterium]
MSFKDNIRKVTPYVAGEQPKVEGKIIKLNTNENPYPPAPGVRKLMDEMRLSDLRLYPNTFAEPLRKELAARYGLKNENFFVGVGSDDVLAMAFLTFFAGEKPVLFPDITYSFYDVWAELFKIPYKRIPLNDEFKINVNDYSIPNGGIVIANPNAPTGICEPLSFIEEMLKKNPDSLVIVDEAYIDFGGESAVSLLSKYENLLVVQTFSKSRSMAGLRIGFAMGSAEAISAMDAVKNSYNSYTMNYPSQVLGVEAVRDEAYFKETCEKIIATRERSKKELAALGFTFPESKTNFIFATHKTMRAEDIAAGLRKRNIFVRHFSKPRIDNYLRISIGTDEEMDAVFAVLKELIHE